MTLEKLFLMFPPMVFIYLTNSSKIPVLRPLGPQTTFFNVHEGPQGGLC